MIATFLTSRRRRARGVAALLDSESGSTLVEFAMVAAPFLFLLTGILEIGLATISSVSLKHGLSEAARQIRVGSAQCLSRDEIKQLICDTGSLLPNCSERLTVRRTSSPLGFGAGMADLLDEDTFDQVQGGEVVLVEATYRWDIISPLVAPILGDAAGDLPLMQSFAFQNETFGAQACP